MKAIASSLRAAEPLTGPQMPGFVREGQGVLWTTLDVDGIASESPKAFEQKDVWTL